MFNTKKKKFEKAANKFLTGSGLLKYALAQDTEALSAMASGAAADDEGLWYSLQVFIGVASRHPSVVARLREQQKEMPAKAETAFKTGIQAAERGNPALFQGENVVGQGLFIVTLAVAISEDDEALADAMVSLQDGAMP